MTCLSLDLSRKIYELCGDDCETQLQYVHDITNGIETWYLIGRTIGTDCDGVREFPAPNFAETIRLLPLIGEKKGWPVHPTIKEVAYVNKVSMTLTGEYMLAETEEAGMRSVEEYLTKLLN